MAIYNVEADGKLPFLIMQYVAGRSLQMRVDDYGPLAVEEILRIGMQAAAGLAAAHAQGLVHRDVKPSNILLEDTVERAVLTDFGLARAGRYEPDADWHYRGHAPLHVARAGDRRADRRAFRLVQLGRRFVFHGDRPSAVSRERALAVLHRICREKHRPVRRANKDIPDELAELIDRLLEKKPSRRPASAEIVRKN